MLNPVTLEPVDYLVIGHVAHDLIPDGWRLGGTAAYSALTAHALGLRVLIDLPLLGCAPDSPYTYEQPHWFCRDEQGRLLEIPHRPGIIAFDWSSIELRDHLVARLLVMLREYQLDGFRAIAPQCRSTCRPLH